MLEEPGTGEDEEATPAAALVTIAFRGPATDVGEQAGEECPVGGARWVFNPRIVRGEAVTVIYSLFENRSGGARTGRLVVYFEPPGRSWRPPAPR